MLWATAVLTGRSRACGGTVVAMAHEHDWDAMYASDEPPPWDIGEAQPALVSFLDRHEIADPVLDAGCGSGTLAVLLAGRGHRVTGFDLSAPAIDRARARAAAEGLDVTFQVADAAQVAELGVRPATVLDSGLLHSLDADAQSAYVTGLAEICPAGALVVVLAMSLDAEQGWGETTETLLARFPGPTWVSSAVDDIEVRARWRGEDLRMPGHLLTTRRA